MRSVIQQLLDGFTFGAVYALFAVGLSVAWGVLKILNMGHGAIFMAGAVAAFLISQSFAVSLWMFIPMVMVICGGLAAMVEFIAFRPLRRQRRGVDETELGTMVTSLGFAGVLTALATKATDNGVVEHLPPSVFDIKSIEIAGFTFTNVQLVMFVAAVVLCLAAAWYVKSTKQGKALRALAVNPEVASILGVNADKLTLWTIVVCGGLAGLAGLIAVALNAVNAQMGGPFLLKAFAITIVGGTGNVVGALVGGLLLGLLEAGVLTFASASYRDVVSFGVMVLVLLLRPTGLLGIKSAERA
jgi:branched-chain amino acid transport system permease protein